MGEQEVCSTITTNSAQKLNLKEGDQVTAAIKSSAVIVEKK
ncbi:MAG: TOBE domain-containing protein [Bacillota bacterium]